MIRNVISVIIGLVTAVICFMLTESINANIHNIGDPTTADMASMPISFWALVLGGWSIGSFIAGYLIKSISKSDKLTLPIIAGTILTLSSVANFMMIKHPLWVIIIGLTIFYIFILLGHKLAKIKST